MKICIVGAGIIGLSIANHLQNQGHSLTVIDSPALPAASHYAGGMLAPYSEAWRGEDRALEWGVRSLALWEKFFQHDNNLTTFANVPAVETLATPSPLHSARALIMAKNTLIVAEDRADLHTLYRVHDWLMTHPASSQISSLLKTTHIREQYPALSTQLSGGLRLSTEYALDNRAVIEYLYQQFIHNQGQYQQKIYSEPEDGYDLHIHTGGMDLARRYSFLNIRGIQGEILRLESTPWSIDLPDSTIRGLIQGRSVYIIPRQGGAVIGATEYEATDRQPQVAGVLDLLTDAVKILPGLRDYTITEVAACVRPVRPDALPWVGRIDKHTIIAAGHGRGGFLLAPLTAQAVGRLVHDQGEGRRDLLDLTFMD